MNLLVTRCKVHILFYGAIWRSSFLDSEVFLFITGRAPNTKRLNLEAVGVELDKTAIKVPTFSFWFFHVVDFNSLKRELNWLKSYV